MKVKGQEKKMPKQLQLPWARGFTLLEVLAAALLVALLTVSLLQATVLALRAYTRTGSHWRQTVDLWNRSNRFLAGQLEGDSTVKPLEQTKRLDRIILTGESGGTQIRWEVLRGQ